MRTGHKIINTGQKAWNDTPLWEYRGYKIYNSGAHLSPLNWWIATAGDGSRGLKSNSRRSLMEMIDVRISEES